MSLRSLASFCYRRRWLVVILWVITLVGTNVAAKAIGADFSTNFSTPNSESTQATHLLEGSFKAQAGDTVQVAVKGTPSVADPRVRADVTAFLGKLRALPHVVSVSDPYAAPGSVSRSGRIALANVQLDARSQEVPASVGRQMVNLAQHRSTTRTQIRLGGFLIQQSERSKPPSSEGLGILAAVVILLIAFGSVLAMGLPIVVAMAGIALGLPIIELLTHLFPLQSFSTTLAAMIGIGVGIDYALFVVTRYRQGLQAGLSPEDAVVTAVDTSGRAVMFAGLTVIIALLGMIAMRLSFISGLGIGSAAVVAVTVLAATTLLPAVLGFVGHKIDALKLPWVHNETGRTDTSVWHRWSEVVQRRPLLLTLAGLAVVVVLALPMLSLRLGFVDAGNDPAGSQTRQSYDLLSEGFGPGFNGPFLLAVRLPGPHQDAVLPGLARAVAAASADGGRARVVSVTPAVVNPAGTTAILRVYPGTAPQDAATSALLHELRHHVIPASVAGTGAKVYVGGAAALTDDFATVIGQRLPFFIGVVIGLSFLLLMIVFRSIVVPLKAAVMNLLSIGAAYGIVVAIFQYGWGASLVGIGKSGPIQAFLPMMMFAILFGLSMDYEVFLLSRIREEYVHNGGDNSVAVADGLAATARVITAAAAIMVTLFLSFVLGDNIVIKLFGIGFASAIFIDATVIRMVVVPAAMELLGDGNWWLPRWLDRWLPHLDVEGPSAVLDHPAEPRPARAAEPAGSVR